MGAGAGEAPLAEVVARAQGAAVAAPGNGQGVAAAAGHAQVGRGTLSEEPGRALAGQVLRVGADNHLAIAPVLQWNPKDTLLCPKCVFLMSIYP